MGAGCGCNGVWMRGLLLGRSFDVPSRWQVHGRGVARVVGGVCVWSLLGCFLVAVVDMIVERLSAF